MKIHSILLAAGALTMLSACGNEPEVAETEVAQTETVAEGTEYAGGPSETMPATAPGADALGPTGATWDANNNGIFEQSEYAAYGDSAFGDWDLNDDNRLDRTEFESRWTAAGWRDPGAAWTAFDDNGDNFLETGEFFGDDEFGEWDRNRSGILETEEWFAA